MEGRRSEEIFADQRDVEDPDITIGQDGETLLIRRDAGVGDHATAIAEQVIYLATGDLPGEDRPKADLTTATGA